MNYIPHIPGLGHISANIMDCAICVTKTYNMLDILSPTWYEKAILKDVYIVLLGVSDGCLKGNSHPAPKPYGGLAHPTIIWLV